MTALEPVGYMQQTDWRIRVETFRDRQAAAWVNALWLDRNRIPFGTAITSSEHQGAQMERNA